MTTQNITVEAAGGTASLNFSSGPDPSNYTVTFAPLTSSIWSWDDTNMKIVITENTAYQKRTDGATISATTVATAGYEGTASDSGSVFLTQYGKSFDITISLLVYANNYNSTSQTGYFDLSGIFGTPSMSGTGFTSASYDLNYTAPTTTTTISGSSTNVSVAAGTLVVTVKNYDYTAAPSSSSPWFLSIPVSGLTTSLWVGTTLPTAMTGSSVPSSTLYSLGDQTKASTSPTCYATWQRLIITYKIYGTVINSGVAATTSGKFNFTTAMFGTPSLTNTSGTAVTYESCSVVYTVSDFELSYEVGTSSSIYWGTLTVTYTGLSSTPTSSSPFFFSMPNLAPTTSAWTGGTMTIPRCRSISFSGWSSLTISSIGDVTWSPTATNQAQFS